MNRFSGRYAPPITEPLEGRRLLSRVAVIGDFTSGAPLNAVATMINGWNPDAVVTVGDNYYNDANIDTSVGQVFQNYIAPYTGAYGSGSTTGNHFWPTLGNHDYDRGVSNYTAYFTLPGNERYYATPAQGDVQFFVVNSNTAEPDGTSSTSKQATWLKSALAASTAAWKLVVFHHPAYTSGTQGDNTRMQWPFQQWGASAVIAGHDHIYERIVKNNFPYFVDGLGGAEIVPATRVESGSQIRYWGDYGAMLLDASASSLNFKFFSRDGTVRDNYTLTKAATTTTSTDLIPLGASWKYLDTGVDAGTAWRDPSFDDTGWSAGAAELGYGDGDEATVVSYGANASNKFITTYFRKHFNVADPSAISALAMSLLRDDGAVVYLNGTEIYRNNMPTGTITSRTLASTAVEDATFYNASINRSLLRSGDNVLAVEIHQADGASSDISFNLSLTATTSGATTPTPTPTPPPTERVPAAPTALTASATSGSSIALAWTDNATNETGTRIERSLDGINFVGLATVAAGVTTYNDENLAAATRYTYRVLASNAAGNSPYSNLASATTASVVNTLPSPWASSDIGAVGVAGTSDYANGVFTIRGGGTDIWSTADSFRFTYVQVSGDSSIVARVASVANTGGWAKAGVMIRASLAANAAEVAMSVTPTSGTLMTNRTSAGANTSAVYAAGSAPQWLKLTRVGKTFTAYRSANGTKWNKVGSISIAMSADVLIGLCVAAKDNTTLNTSTFDNIAITPQPTAATPLTATTTQKTARDPLVTSLALLT